VVVRGQGEESMLEIAERLRDGAPLGDVQGVGFRRDGKPYFTPERPLKPLEEMPPKAYHLADFDAYERICGRRWAMYTSSLACPFNCAYCTNAGVYGRKWNALPVEQVVEETIDLTRRHRLELLWLADDNFLVDIDQSIERCVKAGVIPSFNIIFGFPGEGVRERRETINFMMDVCRRFPGAEFWTNIFTPYPGSPVFYRAKEIGIEVPKSLEGWMDYFPRYTILPWLRGKEHQRVQAMRDYLRVAFDRAPIAADRRDWFSRTITQLTRYPARWRLDHDSYAFPF